MTQREHAHATVGGDCSDWSVVHYRAVRGPIASARHMSGDDQRTTGATHEVG